MTNNDRSYLVSNEAMLRELILRIAGSVRDPRFPNSEPRLVVGALPDDLPFKLALPEGSTIIGCLSRGAENWEVILDCLQNGVEVIAFYQEHYQEEGWSKLEMPSGNNGFAQNMWPGSEPPFTLCGGKVGPSLNIRITGQQGGYNHIILSIQGKSPYSPCANRYHSMRFENVLPTLQPPAGEQQSGGVGNWSSNQISTTATLQVSKDRSSALLAAHYGDQLVQAGWKRLDGGEEGSMVWHTWSFVDESEQEWKARFFMLKMPGLEHTYYLYLRAHWSDIPEMSMW